MIAKASTVPIIRKRLSANGYLCRHHRIHPDSLKIFATGHPRRLAELKEKIGTAHTVQLHEGPGAAASLLDAFDLLFDLSFDDNPSGLAAYAVLQNKPVLVCAVKKSLTQLISLYDGDIGCHLIGFNALPTFINRSRSEVSFLNDAAAHAWQQISQALGWEYDTVEDRPGMVSIKVIAMLINEACFTLEEQTASMHDIDRAMKLGLNYPWGPFEWCDRIGVKEVYETLQAIAAASSDARYKICELLREKYLSQKPFYMHTTNLT